MPPEKLLLSGGVTRKSPGPDQAATAAFTAGDEAIWTGTKGLFSRPVRIVEVRSSYLQILGETPEDARLVYDIADPVIKGTVLGIPASQLHAAERADTED